MTDVPEWIWLDPHSYNGAVGFAHPGKHKKDGWPGYLRFDLCASGQQVRALVEALPRYGMEYDPTADTDYLVPKADGRWLKRDDALAALTPAPQPEATENYADPVSSAPQPAQEAVPVAWRYRYVDPVSGKPIWRYSNNLWNGQRPSESQPLYAHPPQPSETVSEAAMMTDEEISEFIADYGQPSETFRYLTPPQHSEAVAEALRGLMAAYKEIADSGDAGFWKAEETPEYQSAESALRALKGDA